MKEISSPEKLSQQPVANHLEPISAEKVAQPTQNGTLNPPVMSQVQAQPNVSEMTPQPRVEQVTPVVPEQPKPVMDQVAPAPQALYQSANFKQEEPQQSMENSHNDGSFGGPIRQQSTGGGKGLFGQPNNSSSNQLVCINLDTYKAARLNTILSQISINSDRTFRIDPFDTVINEIKRREAAIKAKNLQMQRDQKKQKILKEKEDKINMRKRIQ